MASGIPTSHDGPSCVDWTCPVVRVVQSLSGRLRWQIVGLSSRWLQAGLRGTLLGVALLTTAACSAEEDRQCARTLSYEGRIYYGAVASRPVDVADDLGDATRGPCIEAVDDAQGTAGVVAVSTIDGIVPSLAIVSRGEDRQYVYWTGSRSNPPRAIRRYLGDTADQ